MIRQRDEIRRLFGEGTVAGLSDGQLLERFVTRRDGEAFAAIVARHGAMVHAACQSGLGSLDGAEDAFQATFLVLVRRAGSISVEGSLAGWLYRVARRVARQVRIEAGRRAVRERNSAVRGVAEASPDPAVDEIHRLIHEELAHLPDRHRTAILLCDLHGLTREEAAQAIGCPPGTVAGRLARARVQLRSRLVRRGVTSPVGPLGLAGSVGQRSRLFRETAHAAIADAQGNGFASLATQLAAQASRSLFLARLPANLAIIVGLVATAAATVVLATRAESGATSEPPPPPIRVAAARTTLAQAPPPIDVDDPATAGVFAGRVVDPDGQPVAAAKVYVVPQNVRVQPVEVRAVTGVDGRFRFSAPDLTYTAIDGLPARLSGLLSASAEGYGPDVKVTPGRGSRDGGFPGQQMVSAGEEWTLTLGRGEVPIRGRVLDPDGRPLAGAKVNIWMIGVPSKWNLDDYIAGLLDPGRAQGFERSFYAPSICPGVTTRAVTGPDGRFRIDGVGRDRIVTLEVAAPGMLNDWIGVMTKETPPLHLDPKFHPDQPIVYGAEFDYTAKPGRTVRGVVRDKATGQPLAGVEVGRVGWTTTDEQGRFAVGGFPLQGKLLDDQVTPRPGQPYFPTKLVLNPDGETVVECRRGLPFRLTIRDEEGRPVEAEVGYAAILPNTNLKRDFPEVLAVADATLSKAARQPDGSYLGVALPGPGVVMAKTPDQAGYRPAHVDPKGFFAPGRTAWTAQELISEYGTDEMLSVMTCVGPARQDQHDFAAIVLINPAEGSKPLELHATVVRDRPRQVTLLDPEGRPVVGAKATGLKYYDPYAYETRLRSATFPVSGLDPHRSRRIWFTKEDRKLIGFLMARGDGDTPYTVRMQPWAVATGRFVDEHGRPILFDGQPGPRQHPGGTLSGNPWFDYANRNDPAIGTLPYAKVDDDGRFRYEPLVPGQQYFGFQYQGDGRPSKAAFEGLTLDPGQVADLGEIRLVPPIDPKKP